MQVSNRELMLGEAGPAAAVQARDLDFALLPLAQDRPVLQELARHYGPQPDRSARRRGIAEALQDAARETVANLLAMGGFGHTRIRDFILGGATKGVLSDLQMPVLLSH